MADKQISFSEKDLQQLQEMLIDQDKKAAFKFLAELLERLKGHPGHICGFRPFK